MLAMGAGDMTQVALWKDAVVWAWTDWRRQAGQASGRWFQRDVSVAETGSPRG